MNIDNKYNEGFSLIELMVGTLLSSILLIGFTLLGSGIWEQLSYEDVHEKVQRYGNYVLDDIGNAFTQSDISKISMNNWVDGFTTIQVWINNGNDISYDVQSIPSGPIDGNIAKNQINKNSIAIHKENDAVNQYYNEFENKGYTVSISKFKCNELGVSNTMTKYGNRPFDGTQFKNATYIVDLEIEIYKRVGADMELYNTIDFQRTLFVKSEFI